MNIPQMIRTNSVYSPVPYNKVNMPQMTRKNSVYSPVPYNKVNMPQMTRKNSVYSTVPYNQVNYGNVQQSIKDIIIVIKGKQYGLHPINETGGRSKKHRTRKHR